MWYSEESPRLGLCISEWLAEMVLNSLDRLSLGRGGGDDNTGQGMADGRRKTREGGVLESKRKMCFKEHMVSSTKCHAESGERSPTSFTHIWHHRVPFLTLNKQAVPGILLICSSFTYPLSARFRTECWVSYQVDKAVTAFSELRLI